MKILQLVLLAIWAAAAIAGEPSTAPAVEEARRVAGMGGVDLALALVEQEQPKQYDAPAWAQWEALRLELWANRGRYDEILARALAYPEPLPGARAGAGLLTSAVRAAHRVGEPAQARRLLRRLFASPELGHAEYRAARLAAIEAFLAGGEAEWAYRSMLRFQQDFAPLRAEEAERFVAGLIEAERIGDAANWLSQLDTASPWSALLRLRAKLITPQAAIELARARIGKGDDEAALALLAAAGAAAGSRAIAIEVAEHRLATPRPGRSVPGGTDPVASLWQLYSEAGQQSANQALLLTGDDAAWLAHAARIAKQQPQLARALLGHLALQGGSVQTRSQAQLNLLGALRGAKLGRAALRLFSDDRRFPLETLDARARFELGTEAFESGQPTLAVHYWQGLPTPTGMSAPQWQLRYAEALVHAGKADEALAIARALAQAQPRPSSDLARGLVDVASAAGTYRAPGAPAVLAAVLPFVAAAEHAAVHDAQGRAYEMAGDHRAAAAAYLRAAAASSSPESDRGSLHARLDAARNLLQAGLRHDARAVYAWLARNAKDSPIRELAARKLRTVP